MEVACSIKQLVIIHQNTHYHNQINKQQTNQNYYLTYQLADTKKFMTITDLRHHSQTNFFFFFYWLSQPTCGFWPPHSWGFEITHNDTTQSVGLLWTSDQPIAETCTWQTHNTHNRQISMPLAGFKPAIPARRLQTHALDCLAIGMGSQTN
jgi:hypothetical protein